MPASDQDMKETIRPPHSPLEQGVVELKRTGKTKVTLGGGDLGVVVNAVVADRLGMSDPRESRLNVFWNPVPRKVEVMGEIVVARTAQPDGSVKENAYEVEGVVDTKSPEKEQGVTVKKKGNGSAVPETHRAGVVGAVTEFDRTVADYLGLLGLNGPKVEKAEWTDGGLSLELAAQAEQAPAVASNRMSGQQLKELAAQKVKEAGVRLGELRHGLSELRKAKPMTEEVVAQRLKEYVGRSDQPPTTKDIPAGAAEVVVGAVAFWSIGRMREGIGNWWKGRGKGGSGQAQQAAAESAAASQPSADEESNPVEKRMGGVERSWVKTAVFHYEDLLRREKDRWRGARTRNFLKSVNNAVARVTGNDDFVYEKERAIYEKAESWQDVENALSRWSELKAKEKLETLQKMPEANMDETRELAGLEGRLPGLKKRVKQLETLARRAGVFHGKNGLDDIVDDIANKRGVDRSKQENTFEQVRDDLEKRGAQGYWERYQVRVGSGESKLKAKLEKYLGAGYVNYYRNQAIEEMDYALLYERAALLGGGYEDEEVTKGVSQLSKKDQGNYWKLKNKLEAMQLGEARVHSNTVDRARLYAQELAAKAAKATPDAGPGAGDGGGGQPDADAGGRGGRGGPDRGGGGADAGAAAPDAGRRRRKKDVGSAGGRFDRENILLYGPRYGFGEEDLNKLEQSSDEQIVEEFKRRMDKWEFADNPSSEQQWINYYLNVVKVQKSEGLHKKLDQIWTDRDEFVRAFKAFDGAGSDKWGDRVPAVLGAMKAEFGGKDGARRMTEEWRRGIGVMKVFEEDKEAMRGYLNATSVAEQDAFINSVLEKCRKTDPEITRERVLHVKRFWRLLGRQAVLDAYMDKEEGRPQSGIRQRDAEDKSLAELMRFPIRLGKKPHHDKVLIEACDTWYRDFLSFSVSKDKLGQLGLERDGEKFWVKSLGEMNLEEAKKLDFDQGDWQLKYLEWLDQGRYAQRTADAFDEWASKLDAKSAQAVRGFIHLPKAAFKDEVKGPSAVGELLSKVPGLEKQWTATDRAYYPVAEMTFYYLIEQAKKNGRPMSYEHEYRLAENLFFGEEVTTNPKVHETRRKMIKQLIGPGKYGLRDLKGKLDAVANSWPIGVAADALRAGWDFVSAAAGLGKSR